MNRSESVLKTLFVIYARLNGTTNRCDKASYTLAYIPLVRRITSAFCIYYITRRYSFMRIRTRTPEYLSKKCVGTNVTV